MHMLLWPALPVFVLAIVCWRRHRQPLKWWKIVVRPCTLACAPYTVGPFRAREWDAKQRTHLELMRFPLYGDVRLYAASEQMEGHLNGADGRGQEDFMPKEPSK
jgi:hypothetical protein